jgi:hypothetical protein
MPAIRKKRDYSEHADVVKSHAQLAPRDSSPRPILNNSRRGPKINPAARAMWQRKHAAHLRRLGPGGLFIKVRHQARQEG